MKKFLFFVFLSRVVFSINLYSQWVQVPNGMGNISIWSLANSGNNIFAGTYLNGVYLSTNNGTNWIQTSLNNQWVYSIAVNGSYIFAGTYNHGIYLSTNNGTNWTQTSYPNNQTVRSIVVNGNYILAGTEYGVYKSTNNGVNWIQTSLNHDDVQTLAVNGNNIFAGAYLSGVYKSTDNGTGWIQTSLNNRTVQSLVINGNYIFAGINYPDYGVYLSTNNGTNWTQTSLNNQWIYSLYGSGNNIFAGTLHSGVYVSNDNAANWVQRSEGLGNLSVYTFCLFNNYIFAGSDSSVYRRPINELIGIKPISEQVPSHFALEQNYPNPFNPATNIKFDLPKSANVKLVVYDILGKEVETLVNELLKPGSYEVNFDGGNVASGLYFYKLEAENFVDTKKMILLK